MNCGLWIVNCAPHRDFGSSIFSSHMESETKSCIGWYQLILTVSLDGVDFSLVVMDGCWLLRSADQWTANCQIGWMNCCLWIVICAPGNKHASLKLYRNKKCGPFLYSDQYALLDCEFRTCLLAHHHHHHHHHVQDDEGESSVKLQLSANTKS